MGSKHDTTSEKFHVYRVDLRHYVAVCKLETLLTRNEESGEILLDLEIKWNENQGQTKIALKKEIHIFIADLHPICAEYEV
jgi:hypothetical protein